MKTIVLSLAIGLAAGIIDVIPMIIMKIKKRASVSAFFHYFFVSIIIVNINLFDLAWWLQGGLISLALAIPVIITASESDKKSAPIIASMAIILGTLIGIAGHFLR
jgi:hypothetical protein